MSHESGWHDVHDAIEGAGCRCAVGDCDALMRELAERICPISGGDRHTDAHRYFGQDLTALADGDLVLEAARVTFRLCLEAEGPDKWWLLRRLERIRSEQACRVNVEERQREQEWRNHQAWLRWNAAQNGAVQR